MQSQNVGEIRERRRSNATSHSESSGKDDIVEKPQLEKFQVGFRLWKKMILVFSLFLLLSVAFTALHPDDPQILSFFGLQVSLPKYEQVDPAAADSCRDVHLGPEEGEPHTVDGEFVLVTGGAGFIGSNLVERLLELGYRVRILDNLDTGNVLYVPIDHPRLEMLHGDISSKADLQAAMKDVVGVFHLAAASKVMPSLKDPKMATFNVERNSVGTANVLEVANGTGLVKRFIYSASSTYYGNQQVPFREEDPFVPSSPYAASKYMGELQTLTYDRIYDMACVNLRYFMVYGPRNPKSGGYAIVTGKFVGQMLRGEDLTIEGTGQQYRDFVHVHDIVRANILAYQSSLRFVTINVGSGQTHSVKDVADLVSDRQTYIQPRKYDLLGTMADTCKAKELLRFQARYDFRSAMKELIDLAKDGNADFFSPIWTDPQVEAKLVKEVSNWHSLAADEKNAAVVSLFKKHGHREFIGRLLDHL